MTPEEQEILNYFRGQEWFAGVRAEDSLFYYSAKAGGQQKLMASEYGQPIVESLLAPGADDRLVRVFNKRQASEFHAESERKVLANPEILVEYIKKDEDNWSKIELLAQNIESQLRENDFTRATASFKSMVELYERYGFHFFVIFSLGMRLTENQDKLAKPATEALRHHDKWRNSVALKEEAMGEAVFKFVRALVKEKKLGLDPLSVIKFLTAGELLALIDGEPRDETAKVERRQNGYVYLGLRPGRSWPEVVDDPQTVSEITAEIFRLVKSGENAVGNQLSGQPAYSSGVKIQGRVAVVSDAKELAGRENDLAGKILVTVQTTPHFIPYLKGVKAIITEEGGITCHAAIVAREMEIPTVVGVVGAIQELKEGDVVEVYANQGIIRKM